MEYVNPNRAAVGTTWPCIATALNIVNYICTVVLSLALSFAFLHDLMLPNPFPDPVEVSTLMMRIKIGFASRCERRILNRKHRRHVCVAHESKPQRLDAMIDVHSHADRRVLNGGRSVDDVCVSIVVFLPCILADKVLE